MRQRKCQCTRSSGALPSSVISAVVTPRRCSSSNAASVLAIVPLPATVSIDTVAAVRSMRRSRRLSLYGLIWLIGDFQALRLRPTTVTSGTTLTNCQ